MPYAAENVYKAAWGEGDIDVSSRKTELDIADGKIYVCEGQYSRDNANYIDIDGTLVIKGTSTRNSISVKGGTADKPLRFAINDLSIDQSELGTAEVTSMYMTTNANVSLIVQGNNTFKTQKSYQV